MRKKLLLSIIFLSFQAQGSTFFYGDKPRNLEVNGRDSTLLVFPSPSFTKLCQPGGVVDLNTIQSVVEAQALLPNSQKYDIMDQIRASSNVGFQPKPTSKRDTTVARMLKLTPLRKSGSTICAIRLVSGETVLVRFQLAKHLQRPFIEFKHIGSFKTEGVINKLGGLNVFRDLLQGGDLTYFADVTPVSKRFRTSSAAWTIDYVGTDEKAFKAWRVTGQARKSFEAPEFIRSDFVGQILFSSWRSKGAPRELKADEDFTLFLLTTHDLEDSELKERLP